VLAVSTSKGLALFTAERWNAAKLIEVVRDVPVFSPDGTQLVYPDLVEKGQGPGVEPTREGRLCRMILTHGRSGAWEADVIASKYSTGLLPYAWTRNGDSIIYWEDPDFSASAIADGLKLFRIGTLGGSPQDLGVTVLVKNDMLAISPFGNELVVSAGLGRETWSSKHIAVINLNTMAARYLTDETISAIGPSWSPEGDLVAYAAAPNAANIGGGDQAKACLQKRRIWIADASGINRPKQITNDDHYRDEEPVWSRDGTHILFCRMDRSDVGTLWLMGKGGENPIQVSGPFSVEQGWFGYYGYIDWRQMFDWSRNSS
jgi:Tol biopolymer transport system component